MLSRILIKRYCHSHGRTKCYENIHKLESLRQDVNEIKDFLKTVEKPLVFIHSSSVLTVIASLTVIIKTPFLS
jgi:hypothetical protein